MNFMKLLSIGAALALTVPSYAQDIPKKYVDMFGEMTLAATAGMLCDGISLNKGAVDQRAADFRVQAKKDGYSEEQIDAMSQKIEKNPQLLMGSMNDFRKKHGIGETDVAGLCGAVQKEKSAGSSLGKLVN